MPQYDTKWFKALQKDVALVRQHLRKHKGPTPITFRRLTTSLTCSDRRIQAALIYLIFVDETVGVVQDGPYPGYYWLQP